MAEKLSGRISARAVPDEEQYILIKLEDDKSNNLRRIECIDFVGMSKRHIDEAFKRFFDPQAAKKGAKLERLKTLGGHGNGGKFYMRQMFKESYVVTYREGKMNIFGFNSEKKYGYDSDYEDREMSPQDAIEVAGIDLIGIPPEVKKRILSGDTGFTVIKGERPAKVRGTSKQSKLIEELQLHPQARRLIDRKQVMLVMESNAKPYRLVAPKL